MSAAAKKKFNEWFCRRTRELRDKAGFDHPEDMALRLGVTPSTYKNWEYRSPLPHYLIPVFLSATGYTAEDLFDQSRTARSRRSRRRQDLDD